MKDFQLDYDYRTREELILDVFKELDINFSYELIDNKVKFMVPNQEIECEIFDLDEGIKIEVVELDKER